jgi:hypothetical protein
MGVVRARGASVQWERIGSCKVPVRKRKLSREDTSPAPTAQQQQYWKRTGERELACTTTDARQAIMLYNAAVVQQNIRNPALAGVSVAGNVKHCVLLPCFMRQPSSLLLAQGSPTSVAPELASVLPRARARRGRALILL